MRGHAFLRGLVSADDAAPQVTRITNKTIGLVLVYWVSTLGHYSSFFVLAG
jgi:hypothetical protein